jgi:hypothetical protein
MKNETNKTVVEQLVEKIEHYSNYTIRIPIDAVEQFKEMEKEQMIDFSKVVLKEYKRIRPEDISTIKRLYNETFNTNEK